MKAALVIGMKGTIRGVPDMAARMTPCKAKPITQAATSGKRPVKRLWTTIPVNRTNTGNNQFQAIHFAYGTPDSIFQAGLFLGGCYPVRVFFSIHKFQGITGGQFRVQFGEFVLIKQDLKVL